MKEYMKGGRGGQCKGEELREKERSGEKRMREGGREDNEVRMRKGRIMRGEERKREERKREERGEL